MRTTKEGQRILSLEFSQDDDFWCTDLSRTLKAVARQVHSLGRNKPREIRERFYTGVH